MENSIDLGRPHIGFIDGNKVRINLIEKDKESKKYKIEYEVQKSIFEKISKIPLNKTVTFAIGPDKINWKVNIVKHSSSGGIQNINRDKEEWIYRAYFLVNVIE